MYRVTIFFETGEIIQLIRPSFRRASACALAFVVQHVLFFNASDNFVVIYEPIYSRYPGKFSFLSRLCFPFEAYVPTGDSYWSLPEVSLPWGVNQ